MRETTPPAAEFLDSLIELFYDEPRKLGQFTQSQSDDLPIAYRTLLAHQAHMTVTVEQRHRSEVSVEVLKAEHTATHYVRKILLRRKSDQRVVQFGVVRLILDLIDEAPRLEILSQKIPLGRALINHDVLRQVQLLNLWRVNCGEDLAKLFDVELDHVTYGRTAIIYCNGDPAIELLEIVAPEDTFKSEGEDLNPLGNGK